MSSFINNIFSTKKKKINTEKKSSSYLATGETTQHSIINTSFNDDEIFSCFQQIRIEEKSPYLAHPELAKEFQKAFISQPYAKNAHATHKGLVLNKLIFEGKNKKQTEQLEHIFSYLPLENIFNHCLFNGGFAIWYEPKEQYNLDNFFNDIHIVSLTELQEVYDEELREYHYTCERIDLDSINKALPAKDKIRYPSQLLNFQIFFYERDIYTREPISFYSSALNALFNEAGYTHTLSEIVKGQALFKVLIESVTLDDYDKQQRQINYEKRQVFSQPGKGIKDLANEIQEAEEEHPLIKKLIKLKDTSKRWLTQAHKINDSRVKTDFLSTLENDGLFKVIGTDIKSILPSALRIHPKLLNLDDKTNKLSEVANDFAFKSFIEQELELIRFFETILAELKERYSVISEQDLSDITISIKKPDIATDFMDIAKQMNREKVRALQIVNIKNAREAGLEVNKEYINKVYEN